MRRRTGWSVLAVLFPIVGALAEETLQAPIPQERVKVERTQIEVIVWPPKDDVAACLSLTKSDFKVRLARKPFDDFEIDPVDIPPGDISSAMPGEMPVASSRLVALLFDWWAMGNQGTDEYSPHVRAFTQARAYIEEHPFDRYVIVSLRDDADFQSTTFLPGPESEDILDRLEADIYDTGFLLSPHIDRRAWRNGVLDTISRLGAMEPRETKDLFVLTTGVFPDSDVFEGDLGQLTSQNKVRVNSLDLAWDLHVLPFGLFAFSEAGGGAVFDDGSTLTTAIQTLDQLRPCTFRITLNVPDRKRALLLSVKIKKPHFRVTGPELVGGRFDVAAAENAELQNDFEDPTTEVGVRITPQLVRVSDQKKSAEYALTLHVEKTDGFDPEDVGTLRVYGAVWNKSKPRSAMYADFSAFRITGDALRKIAGSGGEVFRFPETVRIPSREKSVSVIVSVHSPRESLSRVSAARRIEVPLPE